MAIFVDPGRADRRHRHADRRRGRRAARAQRRRRSCRRSSGRSASSSSTRASTTSATCPPTCSAPTSITIALIALGAGARRDALPELARRARQPRRRRCAMSDVARRRSAARRGRSRSPVLLPRPAKTYTGGPARRSRADRRRPRRAPGERVAIVGAVGLGQEHAAASRSAGSTRRRGGEVRVEGRPFATLSEAERGARAQPRARLHLPVPSSAARVHRARERRDAARRSARMAPRRGARAAPRDARARRPRAPPASTCRASSRAASASASRSRARSSRSRAACSPTSRPAISTGGPRPQVFDLMLELNAIRRHRARHRHARPELAARTDRTLHLVDGKLA